MCLNDAPDFDIGVLHALRQPLQDREIVLVRAEATARFPVRFILLAGMCRCPCGGRPGCACTPLQARRYQQRLTSTLGTWLPLRLIVDPPTFSGSSGGDADAVSAARVAEARERMGQRLAGTLWRVNGDIPRAELRRSYPPTAAGLAVLGRAVDLGMVSDLSAGQITGVAWTLADLAGKPRPDTDECARALAFWTEAGR